MRAIGLIPARGGSKGIPQKNITLLAGKPLIAWTCEASKKSKLAETFLSTDDSTIATVTEKYGVGAPFMRPAEFSGDQAPMIDVLKHFCEWLESQKIGCDTLVLLQPTSPLRTSQHIDQALDIFEKSGADSLVSVVELPHTMHPLSVLKKSAEGFLENYSQDGSKVLRRQDKPTLWARNGPAIVMTTPALILSGRLYGDRLVPYVMSRADSVDIDDLDDLEWAEFLMKKRGHS